MKNAILKNALINAGATALYIVAVASFMIYTPDLFGEVKEKTVLIPIVMLSLLVFSAALVGTLIFGRPIMWYLDGKKKEALSLLVATLAIFLVILIMFALFLYSKHSPAVSVNN